MEEDVAKWMRRIKEFKKGDADLSRDEDLSLALMNLISLEEHFYFTAMKTDNSKYLEMLDSIRSLRKKLLKKIVVNPKGEEWCISKHLLAASMRLTEVGTKELAKKDVKEANMFFKAAFELHSLFFAINMNLVEVKNLETDTKSSSDNNLMKSFSKIMKKIVDCCKE